MKNIYIILLYMSKKNLFDKNYLIIIVFIFIVIIYISISYYLHYNSIKNKIERDKENKQIVQNDILYDKIVSLENNLKKWKHRMPIREDFAGGYKLFGSHSFTVLLKELNLIDKKLIKKEYDMLSEKYKEYAKESMLNHINYTYHNKNVISHKESLKNIK